MQLIFARIYPLSVDITAVFLNLWDSTAFHFFTRYIIFAFPFHFEQSSYIGRLEILIGVSAPGLDFTILFITTVFLSWIPCIFCSKLFQFKKLVLFLFSVLVCIMQKQIVSITSLACDYLSQEGELAILAVKSEWADPPALFPDEGSLQISQRNDSAEGDTQLYLTSILCSFIFLVILPQAGRKKSSVNAWSSWKTYPFNWVLMWWNHIPKGPKLSSHWKLHAVLSTWPDQPVNQC